MSVETTVSDCLVDYLRHSCNVTDNRPIWCNLWELDEDSKRGGLGTFQDTTKFLRNCSPHSNALYARFAISGAATHNMQALWFRGCQFRLNNAFLVSPDHGTPLQNLSTPSLGVLPPYNNQFTYGDSIELWRAQLSDTVWHQCKTLSLKNNPYTVCVANKWPSS